MSYRNYSSANSRIVDQSNNGDFSTIAAAITAASSGQTIFIRPGTYTEDLTLKAGVNLCAFDCDANTPNVTIVGKCTFTAAGTVTISGIRLQTNSDFFLAVTGSEASIVNLKSCFLLCNNNTGISYTSSSGSSEIYIMDCIGRFGATGIAMWSMTSSGSLRISGSDLFYGSATSTASSNSAGQVLIKRSALNFPISTSSTGALDIQHTSIQCNNQSATSITTAGTGTSGVTNSNLSSGSAVCVSVGTGTTIAIQDTAIRSSNTNAIDGLGTIQFTSLTYSSSSIISTTTQTPLYVQHGKWKASGQPAFLAFQGANIDNVTGAGTSYTIGSTALTEVFDQDANFNTNGTFTAPVTGKYHLDFQCGFTGLTVATNFVVNIVTSNRTYQMAFVRAAGSGGVRFHTSALADMDAADTATYTVSVSGEAGDTADISGSASQCNTFVSGFLAC